MSAIEGRTWTVNAWTKRDADLEHYTDSQEAIARIKELAAHGYGIHSVQFVPHRNHVVIGLDDHGFWKEGTCFVMGHTMWKADAIEVRGAQ